MQTKAYMSALAGAIFLAGSRAHWRIPAILSGTLMMVLALSACTRSSARTGRDRNGGIRTPYLQQSRYGGLAHGARHQHRRAGAAGAG